MAAEGCVEYDSGCGLSLSGLNGKVVDYVSDMYLCPPFALNGGKDTVVLSMKPAEVVLVKRELDSLHLLTQTYIDHAGIVQLAIASGFISVGKLRKEELALYAPPEKTRPVPGGGIEIEITTMIKWWDGNSTSAIE